MRIPNAVHEAGPWRIREIAPDFTVEDVWALPAHGGVEDFQRLLELMSSSDPADRGSVAAGILWRVRDLLGKWLRLGRISAATDSGAGKLPIPGTDQTSLADRLPPDLPTDGRLRQATRSFRDGVPGAHQAVPVLGCVSSAHAAGRTKMAGTRAGQARAL
jgi:hypothetical protein